GISLECWQPRKAGKVANSFSNGPTRQDAETVSFIRRESRQRTFCAGGHLPPTGSVVGGQQLPEPETASPTTEAASPETDSADQAAQPAPEATPGAETTPASETAEAGEPRRPKEPAYE